MSLDSVSTMTALTSASFKRLTSCLNTAHNPHPPPKILCNTSRPTYQSGRWGTPCTNVRRFSVPKDKGGIQPPLEHLTVQVQLSRRIWATIHNIFAAPIRSAGITDTFDLARLQMVQLTFVGGDLNAHSHLWDTNQPSDTLGEPLEDWDIAHSASVINDGTATLPNRATSGLSSTDESQAHPSLVDKAEWTVGKDNKCRAPLQNSCSISSS